MIVCDPPPVIRRLIATDIGDTFATLRWHMSRRRRGDYYGLELKYKKKGELPATHYQLSKWETFAVVRDLEPNTTYLSTMFTENQCARTESAVATFRTKVTVLHPNILKVMPHEIILTIVVMFIWLMIVRRFCQMYGHVAMVNPVTYGGYRIGGGDEQVRKQESSSSLSMRTPRTSLVSSGNATLDSVHGRRRGSTVTSRPLKRHDSNHSLYSQQGHHTTATDDRISLLAGALDKWRSEVGLAHMEGTTSALLSHAVPAVPVRSSAMRAAQSWTDVRPTGGGSGRKKRRTSTMSAVPNQSALPMVRISIEEEDEEDLETMEMGDSTGGNDEDRKDSVDSIGSLQHPRLTLHSESLNVTTGADYKRKISSLLLGKATTDIRRCSSPPQVDGAQMSRLREMIGSSPKLSRLSIFRSFRRNPQKAPPVAQMTMVTEEEDDSIYTDETTNSSDPYRDFHDHYRTQRERGRLLQTPADAYRQDSSDSYVTASEYRPDYNNQRET